MMKGTLRIGLMAIAMACASASPAAADATGDFLKALDGKFKGRGTARLTSREETEKVTCQMNNSYDSDAKELKLSGSCASAQAKSSVRGKLSHEGGNVSGTLFDQGASITKSNGKVSGGQLTIETNLMDKAGKLIQTRQVIRLQGRGFSAKFYVYDKDSSKFELSGSMDFTGS